MKNKVMTAMIVALLAGPGIAQQKVENPAAQSPAAAPNAADAADGEVRRIDKSAGKVTLRHGEIKHLDMPPMSMVFQVRDKALLDRLKPGDKVKFHAVREGGAYIVTHIDLAP